MHLRYNYAKFINERKRKQTFKKRQTKSKIWIATKEESCEQIKTAVLIIQMDYAAKSFGTCNMYNLNFGGTFVSILKVLKTRCLYCLIRYIQLYGNKI